MRAGNLRLQTHTQKMYYLLIFHCNNGWKTAPQCYDIRAVHVWLLYVILFYYIKWYSGYCRMERWGQYLDLKKNATRRQRNCWMRNLMNDTFHQVLWRSWNTDGWNGRGMGHQEFIILYFSLKPKEKDHTEDSYITETSPERKRP